MREHTQDTLRINDGYQSMGEASIVKIRAFQLTSKELRAALDVVTIMYSPLYILFLSLFILTNLCNVFRDFPIHGMLDFVLFKLGASRSFVSLVFGK